MGNPRQEIFYAFIHYLKMHGYPESSLAIEMPIGNFKVDLAIIDPDIKVPIAIFEFIDGPVNPESDEMQLAAILGVLGNSDIPAYLVYQSISDASFGIIKANFKGKINENDKGRINPNDLPPFNVLKESAKNLHYNVKKREQEKTFDMFKLVCWSMAFVLFIVVLLDIIKVITINANQLALIGAIVALVIIPFASKLKLLGMEFERLMDKESKKEKEH